MTANIPPESYVEDFAQRHGVSRSLAVSLSAIVWAEAQHLVLANARPVWHENGTGPWCSACGAVPALCKHIPDTQEADRG